MFTCEYLRADFPVLHTHNSLQVEDTVAIETSAAWVGLPDTPKRLIPLPSPDMPLPPARWRGCGQQVAQHQLPPVTFELFAPLWDY